MTAKERPTRRKKSQHDKFVELAREVGADEDEDAFIGKLRRIVKPKPPKKKRS